MKPLLIALTMLTPAQDSTIEREQQELLNEQRNDVEHDGNCASLARWRWTAITLTSL